MSKYIFKNVIKNRNTKLKVIHYINAIFNLLQGWPSLCEPLNITEVIFKVTMCDILSVEYFQWRDCDI